MRKGALISLAAGVLFAAGSVRGEGETPPGPAQTGEWPAPLERVQRKDLETTAPVLVRIHLANKLDIALGRMADARAVRPEVRRLGRLVATDVQRIDDAIARYARSRRDLDLEAATRVVDHTRALQRHVADVEARMRAVPGGSFDKPYLVVMNEMVDEVLELLGEGWQTAQDPGLRAQLDRLGTLMRQHQEIARVLAAREEERG